MKTVSLGLLVKVFLVYHHILLSISINCLDHIYICTCQSIGPGSPGDLFVNEVNSTAIVITWDQPDVTNGIITSYEILYSVGNVKTVSDNDTSVLVYATTNTSYGRVIGGLGPFTMYTVVVRAYTHIEAGELTDTFSILTDPDSKCIMLCISTFVVIIFPS